MTKQCKWVDEVIPHAPWIITECMKNFDFRILNKKQYWLRLPRWYSILNCRCLRRICYMQKTRQIQSNSKNSGSFNHRYRWKDIEKQITLLHKKLKQRNFKTIIGIVIVRVSQTQNLTFLLPSSLWPIENQMIWIWFITTLSLFVQIKNMKTVVLQSEAFYLFLRVESFYYIRQY